MDFLKSWVISELRLPKDSPSWSMEPVTGDLGTRRYYRVKEGKKSWILCSWAVPLTTEDPFFKAHTWLSQKGFPVPRILAVDTNHGLILQEDLGNTAMSTLNAQDFFSEVLPILTKLSLQKYDDLPSSHPFVARALDEALFRRELTLTRTEFLANHLKARAKELATFDAAVDSLLTGINDWPRVVCHRDFHVNNLFLHSDHFYLIDFQDMRLGFGGYDLYSLLFERQGARPVTDDLFERRLPHIRKYWEDSWYRTHLSYDEFLDGFLIHGIQRSLKVLGNFIKYPAYFPFIDENLRVLGFFSDRTSWKQVNLIRELDLPGRWKG